jgi:hypothetical protein
MSMSARRRLHVKRQVDDGSLMIELAPQRGICVERQGVG